MAKSKDKDERMAEKQFPLWKKVLFTILFTFFCIAALIAIGELGVRTLSPYQFGKPPKPQPPYNTAIKDSLLGWKMTPNYRYSGALIDHGGQKYPVQLNYDQNGFKAFGMVDTERPKVFFLGDSYTASVEVSNERSFFELIQDSLDIEIFAYGQAGFGTLQQYMVFDHWVDSIQPDLVIWQLCCNDFVDNNPDLEKACGYKIRERRPYLGPTGVIYYERPVSSWQNLQEKLHFFDWLEDRWHGLKHNVFGIPTLQGEDLIALKKRAYPPFNQSVLATEKIIQKTALRKPKATQIIGFSADNYQPQLTELRRIFQNSNFGFTDQPLQLIEAAEGRSEKNVVRASDGYHYNELGHVLIASALIPVIRMALLEHPED